MLFKITIVNILVIDNYHNWLNLVVAFISCWKYALFLWIHRKSASSSMLPLTRLMRRGMMQRPKFRRLIKRWETTKSKTLETLKMKLYWKVKSNIQKPFIWFPECSIQILHIVHRFIEWFYVFISTCSTVPGEKQIEWTESTVHQWECSFNWHLRFQLLRD